MVENVEMAKRRLRQEILSRFRKESSSDSSHESQKICDHLLNDQGFQKARVIGLYCALADEVDTAPIHDLCLEEGKKTAYPHMNDRQKSLTFYFVKSRKDLIAGPFKLFQPDAEKEKEVSEVDLFLVPGLAFTAQGGRLGRGQGYYDRTLSQKTHANALRYGIARNDQIRDDLPLEEWDVPVHKVITPRGVFESSPTGDDIERKEL